MCWLVVNTLSPEDTLTAPGVSASRVLSSFKGRGRGVGTPWCAVVCVRAVCEGACEGDGSHRGLSNISNVNSDESYRSWEYVCTRV